MFIYQKRYLYTFSKEFFREYLTIFSLKITLISQLVRAIILEKIQFPGENEMKMVVCKIKNDFTEKCKVKQKKLNFRYIFCCLKSRDTGVGGDFRKLRQRYFYNHCK